ncbi:hypothetical protein QCA50_001893 [Cerrena zonata]|uniref:Isochorismatase-like domain-containing protein n=1 Tax=Cerrena zonata TaxID=2478898 RepID=A0AAW0GXX8_9APHY
MSTPGEAPVAPAVTPRLKVETATVFGNPASFYVEYPSGLVDLTRSPSNRPDGSQNITTPNEPDPPALDSKSQWELEVEEDRVLRLNKSTTAIVIIDMQNYFLHPDIRSHPTGLACVDPLLKAVPALRSLGAEILWVNWGLTDAELLTIPPQLVRGFTKGGKGGFGSEMPDGWGRLLMRDAKNSELYGPLQTAYEEGKANGTDVWIHKNRMSGLWGPQTALDLYLQEKGITSLIFAGVNADQCVLGTLVDSYFRGYDCITMRDGTATTSPPGGLENVLYNAGRSYGFVTDSTKIVAAAAK